MGISRAYYGAFQLAYNYVRDSKRDPLVLFAHSLYLRQNASLHRDADDMASEAHGSWSRNESLESVFQKTNLHDYVKKQFDGGKDEKPIFHWLDTLRKNRNQADYNEVVAVSLALLNQSVDYAVKVRDRIISLG